MDIDLRLAAKSTVTFDDNHDAILGLRLGTEFEEGHGGKAVNAEGVTGWQRLRGARSAWVDWHATVGGEDVGVAVMDAPTNFRFPTPWHVRDYALLFASPFAFHDYKPSAPDASLTLKPGDDAEAALPDPGSLGRGRRGGGVSGVRPAVTTISSTTRQFTLLVVLLIGGRRTRRGRRQQHRAGR